MTDFALADLSPDAPRPAFAAEVDEELVDNVAALIEDGQQGMVLNLTADLHPADLARLLAHLDPDEARTLFGWLPNEAAGAVLPELETARRSDLLDELGVAALAGLIDEISTDDAADVLGDMSDELAARVLPQLEDAAEVRHLMGYADDTAGGLMDARYVAVPEGATVDEATEIVRGCAEEVDPVYVVFVTDEARRFLGTVSLMRLLLARGAAPVRELMQTDAVSVTADVDQEEVARIMERYDLAALPVLTPDGRLLGRITIDDVVDVIREEAEEDLQRASGITGEEEVSSTVFQISKGRLVWLLLGLVGAFASGLVIKGFEGSLERATVLAVFIPVVMAMAGNAGIQSSAISVQGLVSGDIWGSDLLAAARQRGARGAAQRRRAGRGAGRGRVLYRARRELAGGAGDHRRHQPVSRRHPRHGDRRGGAHPALARQDRPGARDGAVYHGHERHPRPHGVLPRGDRFLPVTGRWRHPGRDASPRRLYQWNPCLHRTPLMSTLTVARKGGQIAIASDSLTTFDELKLPPENDAEPEKVFAVETEHGPAFVGVVGYAAHFLVLQSALEALGELDFSSRRGVFDTFHDLHPLLEGRVLSSTPRRARATRTSRARSPFSSRRRTASTACTTCARSTPTASFGRWAPAATGPSARCGPAMRRRNRPKPWRGAASRPASHSTAPRAVRSKAGRWTRRQIFNTKSG